MENVIHKKKVLFVDLDKTLIRVDSTRYLLVHSFPRLHKYIEFVNLYFLRDKLLAKEYLAQNSNLNSLLKKLDYSVIDFIGKELKNYKKIVLITGSTYTVSKFIFDRLEIFHEHYFSEGKIFLKGNSKLNFMNAYSSKHFDYLADSRVDLVIWKKIKFALIPKRCRLVRFFIELFHKDIKVSVI